MELTIDKFGRVLIPKEIRNLLGLVPGRKLHLTVNEEYKTLHIETETEPEVVKLEYTDWGFPIVKFGYTLESDGYADSKALIKETYDEYHLRKFGF